jgi:hypothetical protein
MMTMTSASVTTPTAAIRGNVLVTGRRVVATIIDGFVIGGIYAAMAATFGTITTDTGVRHWVATMPAAGTVAYTRCLTALTNWSASAQAAECDP